MEVPACFFLLKIVFNIFSLNIIVQTKYWRLFVYYYRLLGIALNNHVKRHTSSIEVSIIPTIIEGKLYLFRCGDFVCQGFFIQVHEEKVHEGTALFWCLTLLHTGGYTGL